MPSPGNGKIFIPSHLRVLHVSNCECLVDEDLKENIKLYGVVHADKQLPDGEAKKSKEDLRLEAICRMIGMEDHVLRFLNTGAQGETEKNKKNWAAVFSHTDFARLNLAR